MAKYRALEDVPPGIKKGDVVDFKEPLVPGFASRFTKAGDDEETTETAGDNNSNALKTGINNPDRNELKKKADELGIDYAPNIPTTRLMELLQEAEAKRLEGDGSEGSENFEGDEGTNSDEDDE